MCDDLQTGLKEHLLSRSPPHLSRCSNACLPERLQSGKHILNQPADVNAELVKKALNPDDKQWSLLARNVVLGSSLALGSPATSLLCPKELCIAGVAAIAEATAQLTTVEAPMPHGCTSVAPCGAPGNETIIEKIEWSWSNVPRRGPGLPPCLAVPQRPASRRHQGWGCRSDSSF